MPDIQKISVAVTGDQLSAMREAVRDWQLKRAHRQDELARLRQAWAEGKESGGGAPLDVEEALIVAKMRSL